MEILPPIRNASFKQEPLLKERITVPQGPRDRALMKSVKEALSLHRYLHALPLDIVVRGGVAHVRGTVPTRADRECVRHTLSRVKGINAVWDVLRTEGEATPRVIDIGCGRNKEVLWATGVDRFPYEGVDVVCDLEKELSFADAEIDHVFAIHVLEHIHNLSGLMNEIHRVLKPGGVLHALVPNAACINAAADPTHVRFFNQKTFKFFCRSYPGLRPFRPGCIAVDQWNVYADLLVVRDGEAMATDEELAYFFD